eukprot:TRINITY_DN6730_c0_g1_i1.p1 TRINITY_DN6730_c0_g1~~TRINITY_DN6730_c0_g1_i1.p1  ORF type:complete len:215 (+),score=29.28 TRINITY_DN6730_c0_g1_i1:17-661(+)
MKKGNNRHQAPVTLPPVQVVTLGLPPPDVDLAGPTAFCNWVIQDRLLMGAYPKRTTLLRDLLRAGITTFISLVHDRELARLETYGPYFATAQRLVSENSGEMTQKVKDLQFVHFPISDKDIAADDEVIKLVENIEKRLLNNEKIFIHCRGGHGRTGTIVAILLGRLFKLEAYDALEKVKEMHDFREDIKKKPGVYSCPETSPQINQVYRVLGKI